MRAALLATSILLSTLGLNASATCYVTSDPQVDQEAGGDRFYVQVDGAGAQGIFVYEEANSIDGLQRRDANVGDQACGFPDELILGASA